MSFPHGHALLVGVGTHRFAPQIDVPITVADARAVAEVLRNTAICGYPEQQVQLLQDASATKAGILAALTALAQRTSAGDTVLLFYCGHGALGTDGNYYLVSHDAKLQGNRVVAGTGVSEGELLDKLRAIKAQRLLMIFNACHSGNISPSLEPGQATLTTSNPSEEAAAALLGTGKGRIIMTACREEQVSYIGAGKLTIFTQALVDGLRGKGVPNRNGFISAFSLYEHLYETVSEFVQNNLNATQEPELTVLKGIGSFAVALYKGASALGDFDSNETLPQGMAVHEVRPEKSAKNFDQRVVQTSGGPYVGRDVNTSGDFVGRDKVGGDKTDIGNISGSTGIAIGRGAQSTVNTNVTNPTSAEFAQLTNELRAKLNGTLEKLKAVHTDKPDVQQAIQTLGDVISGGSISGSTGIAIGHHVRMVVNQLNLPDETVSALLDVRHILGGALGLDPARYRLETLLAEKTRNFVGRVYVFEAIGAFLSSHPSGYFVIEGDPGMGKSSILAEYVRRTGCLAHFNVRAQGITTASQFLESICAQIIVDAGLSYPVLPANTTQDGAFLAKVLQEASDKLAPGERLVIVVDALDEVDPSSYQSGANILYLPKILPKGIYFIMTRRPDEVPLVVEASQNELDLMTYHADNRADVEAYLTSGAMRPGVKAWIDRQTMDGQPLTVASFIAWLADLSEDNFMYLRYVLPEIETGAYKNREIKALPKGLTAYYEDHWDRMGMRAKPLPELKITIVYILCEVRHPVSLKLTLDILVYNKFDAGPLQVQAVLDEWAQFLHEQPAQEGTRYSVYHASFLDFLYRKDIVQAAGMTIKDIHALIADYQSAGMFYKDEEGKVHLQS